jgi:glucokinase
MVLGIDIGGSSLKFALVNENGDIFHKAKYDTKEFVANGFEQSLIQSIQDYLDKHEGITGVGMGFPGLLSADRKKVLLLPNIPAIKNINIVDPILARFPFLNVRIENDAKCAAMGEYKFGSMKGQTDFLLVTLGTGVGSGAIINHELFIGARGNGTEIGHMILREGRTVEQLIGLKPLLEHAGRILELSKEGKLKHKEVSMSSLIDAAVEGDKPSLELFAFVGKMLGDALVSVIRVLDINQIIIGGGISNAYECILPELRNAIFTKLPSYYTESIMIKKASLSNDAGVLGAAGLVL